MAQTVVSARNAGDLGSIPGSGISPGEGNNKPLQYACLQNPMDRGALWATYSPWGPKKLDVTEATQHGTQPGNTHPFHDWSWV